MSDEPSPIETLPPLTLEFLAGSRRDEQLTLSIPGRYSIGCHEGCAISFLPDAEPFVSTEHAELTLQTTHAEIIDLGSSNGTFVDGHEISGRHRVYRGDIIEIGLDGPRFRVHTDYEGYSRPHMVGRKTVILERHHTDQHTPSVHEEPSRKKGTNVAFSILLLFLLVAGVGALAALRPSPKQISASSTSSSAPQPSLGRTEPVAPEILPFPTQLPALQEDAATLVNQYGPAVFLLALEVVDDEFLFNEQLIPRGHLIPIGTAFAVRTPTSLATNGHVLEMASEMASYHAPFVRLVAVQNETGVVHSVLNHQFHPKSNTADMSQIIYDVAILDITPPAPSVFTVASQEELNTLRGGEKVYSIGFPIEKVGRLESLYGYDRPSRVVATLREGVIQRVTRPDGGRGSADESRLVHLGLVTSGGQSGSPIFTADGKVVAVLSATAVAQVGRSQMPHPGMYTYSVRADALREITPPAASLPATPTPPAAEAQTKTSQP